MLKLKAWKAGMEIKGLHVNLMTKFLVSSVWPWCPQEVRQVPLCCLQQWCQQQPHQVLKVQAVSLQVLQLKQTMSAPGVTARLGPLMASQSLTATNLMWKLRGSYVWQHPCEIRHNLYRWCHNVKYCSRMIRHRLHAYISPHLANQYRAWDNMLAQNEWVSD